VFTQTFFKRFEKLKNILNVFLFIGSLECYAQ